MLPNPETVRRAQPFRRRSRQLAEWAFARLVNRTSSWGAYIPPGQRVPGKEKSWTAPAKRLRGEITLDVTRMAAHFVAAELGHVMGLHAASEDGLCKWGAIDIDRHGDPNDPTPDQTFDAAVCWFELLVGLGFSPLLTDSNGKGGYHLRVLFDEPVPMARVYWFLQWVVRDWRQRHFPIKPETYPKNHVLPPAGFGNWLRVPGRHHTDRDHWSRVWDGQKWIDGDAAIDVMLALAGDPASLIPAEAGPPKTKPLPPPIRPTGDVGNLVKRCEAYIARMPDALSGARGHDRTFNVTCEIYRFGLDGSDAKAVLQSYNATRTGGDHWSDVELDHKLRDARARVMNDGEFGMRLREDRPFGSALQRRRDEKIASALQRQNSVTRRPINLAASKSAINSFPTIVTRAGSPGGVEA